MSVIKVLIVDDSSTMRHILASVLSRDPGIQVVGQAEDAYQAREAIKQLNPDVMTLDVEMPNMNGLDFLERVMRLRPMPIIMVSTLTAKGTDIALAALELGAFDCVGKPSSDNPGSLALLPNLIKAAAPAKDKIVNRAKVSSSKPPASYQPDSKVIAIGSSTGGVEALQAVLSQLPENCPPVVITQHMPPNFTKSLAERMNRLVAPKVVEATHGAALVNGTVYLAPGGDSHMEVSGSGKLFCSLKAGPPKNGHCPSVDVLFSSVARHAKSRALGVILTGMGRDGASGLLEIKNSGGQTLGQDEASSIVYGMPKVAFELGSVQRQLPLNSIGNELVRMTNVAAG